MCFVTSCTNNASFLVVFVSDQYLNEFHGRSFHQDPRESERERECVEASSAFSGMFLMYRQRLCEGLRWPGDSMDREGGGTGRVHVLTFSFHLSTLFHQTLARASDETVFCLSWL